ncbi:DNA starvation/stationary phase protection protein, partial [Staphylococcus pettenkoferi]|uniref:DNA starvation/stationary phase protection protein n=1 Tax=Staphylococcus pettenkoferi TaxID=170573 RepID=UPI001C92F487
TRFHNFHSYLKPPNFFPLHTKFQQLYHHPTQFIHHLPQPILPIPPNPLPTLTQSLHISIIDQTPKYYKPQQMLAQLSKHFTNLSKQLQQPIQLPPKPQHHLTQDMFI